MCAINFFLSVINIWGKEYSPIYDFNISFDGRVNLVGYLVKIEKYLKPSGKTLSKFILLQLKNSQIGLT